MGLLRQLFYLVLLCTPGGLAALVSAQLARTSKDEWVLLAWVPPLPLFAFGLYVWIIQLRDPTAGNLWPFVMVALILLSALLFGAFVIARRLFGSDTNVPHWRNRHRR